MTIFSIIVSHFALEYICSDFTWHPLPYQAKG